MAESSPDDVWDEAIASGVTGRVVLIGCTYLDAAGDPVKQEQMFGTVVAVDRGAGFEVRLQGQRDGETWWMPPDTRGIQAAQPGVYRLRSTGEEVENPDFLANWTISQDADN